MIQLTLKAKHLYLIASVLLRESIQDSFSTVQAIKTACTDKLDTDDVVINIDYKKVLKAFSVLTIKPEGQFASINAEMDALLMPQILAGVVSETPEEWLNLADALTNIGSNNANVVPSLIASAKQELFQ